MLSAGAYVGGWALNLVGHSKYEKNEPAFAEDLNGASITIFGKDGKAVDGADKTLKVEVTASGQSRTFDLRRDGSKPGGYVAQFIPTKTGVYKFRFFGTIDTQAVNETFESGPNRFDEVISKADLQFPLKVPSNADLAAQVQGAKPADGTAAVPSVTTGAAQRAQDTADSARMLAIGLGGVGTVFGVIGLGIGGVAWRSRPTGPSTGADAGKSEPI